MSPASEEETAQTECFDLVGPRLFQRRRLSLPALSEGWVRIRFLYCGVCGSDISCFEGKRRIDYPRSMGHEFIARVVAVGTGVNSVQSGDVVTSDLNYRCGHCDPCAAGKTHLCANNAATLFTNRGFSEQADIHASYLRVLSGEIGPHLAPAEPLSCVLHGLAWLGLETRSHTLVVGGGGLGLCAAFALDSCLEAGTFDIVEKHRSRRSSLDAALSRGHALEATNRSYETVLDVSGTSSGLQLALARVAKGGRLCTLSHLDGEEAGSFLFLALQRRDISYKGSYLNGPSSNLDVAARFLAQNWSARWNECLAVSPVAEIQGVFEQRRASRANKEILKIDTPSFSR